MVIHATTAAARYTRTAIILHWAIAVLIILNLAFGFFMEDFPGRLRFLAVFIHISAGMTVLLLTVVRVVWRLTHEPPPYPADMKPWERHTAHLVHFALYAAMVVMPLIGWGIISAHPPAGSAGAAYEAAQRGPMPAPAPPAGPNQPRSAPKLRIWFLIPLPMIAPIEQIGVTPGGVEPQKLLHDEFVEWHEVGAFILIALLLLHVAGALKHQLIDKHREFARMGIGKPEGK